jgi:5-methylcytosine-specific restriction endonuclease McrA
MTVKGDKMPDDISGTSLAGYGAETYARYHYTCVYCGFDGRGFDAWMQLTVDHIKPTSAGGKDDPDNLVPACHACNSITSRMPFTDTASREEILAQKRERVRQRRVLFHDYWLKTVAPHFLDRPLPSA